MLCYDAPSHIVVHIIHVHGRGHKIGRGEKKNSRVVFFPFLAGDKQNIHSHVMHKWSLYVFPHELFEFFEKVSYK